MLYINAEKKIPHRQWIAGLKKALEHGTRQDIRDYYRKTWPPKEIEVDGVRYFSLNSTIEENFCTRKRAYALARDPAHSFVTDDGHTMIKVNSIFGSTS